MLDAAPPLVAEGEVVISSVSPISSHSYDASTTSTSAVSLFDGTSRSLSTSSLPTRPHSSPPSLDMAIRPACFPSTIHHGDQAKVKRPRVDAPTVAVPAPPSPPVEPDSITPAPRVPSLSQIAQSLRQRLYLSRRRNRAEARLRSIQIASTRLSRQLQSVRSVQRTLAECIKAEDKASFLNLSNALRDSLVSSLPFADPEDLEEAAETDDHRTEYQPTFLEGLSSCSRGLVLDLLSKVRYDGVFLANTLASLTHKELVALLPNRNPGHPTESIFGSTTWSASRTSRHLGYTVDTQTELLSSTAYGSSLELLIHGVRGISGSQEYESHLSLDVWSTVCARLLIDQKPGSEKIVPAVLDVWAASAEPPGKNRLQAWMLDTLQLASFLTDQPNKQTFRMRMETRQEPPADDHLQAEAFYTQAVNSLLDLLADQTGPSVIPQVVLDMCQAIGRKMLHSPGHHRGFPHFIVLRWLFSPYFFEVLTLPEAFGMMLDCYIPDNVRHRVLREIASRVQRAIFNVAYPWKYGVHVLLETSSRVRAVMDRFQALANEPTSNSPKGGSNVNPFGLPRENVHLVVSASDVVGLINALFPSRRPASISSDQDTLHSGLQSSASSISGFSLFRHPSSSESPNLDLASYAPETVPTGSGNANVDLPSCIEQDGPLPAFGSNLDVSHLREACAELEETVSTVLPGSSECWVTLVATPDQADLYTTHDVFFRGLSTPVVPSILREGAAQQDDLTMLVEDLLLQDTSCGSASDEDASVRLTDTVSRVYSKLQEKLQDRVLSARSRSDFLDEISRIQDLRDFESATNEGQSLDTVLAILVGIEDRVNVDLMRDEAILAVCESRFRHVKPSLDRCRNAALTASSALDRLRDKMWYVADVRTSAAYDEARGIAAALKVMGIPKQPLRPRSAPPLRYLSGSKISSTGFHLKSEAQILELLSTSPDQGGPNKLSDEQSRATASWMERNNIENLCRGEERLHKLCMEVKKCVDQLMTSEGTMVWSNALFARETASLADQNSGPSPMLPVLQATASRYRQLTLHTNLAPSIDTVSSASHPLSSASSRDFVESRSPALTSKSSMPFWSPAVTEAQSPSSATSVGSAHARGILAATRKRRPAPGKSGSGIVGSLRASLTSLLLSDLGSSLFSEGSETDKAFWHGLGGEITHQHLRARGQGGDGRPPQDVHASDRSTIPYTETYTFNFADAFERLLRSFSAASDPCVKLDILYDVDRLLVMQGNIARTPKTKLMHEAANGYDLPQLSTNSSLAEECINGFHSLFSDSRTRPRAVFRDLQYIAALVPASVLENTAHGKAFWNAAIAISRLKHEVRDVMVETADSIIAYHSNNRGHGRSSSTAQRQRDSATFSSPSRTPSAEDIGRYSMADAAYLLQITAKEGDHAAQRELATLYLTHPELMDHIIAPFARPRDVFKDELESKWRKNQDPNRCDPTTMCVAHHWMSLSSKGGDALAKEYLRQREEMERLP